MDQRPAHGGERHREPDERDHAEQGEFAQGARQPMRVSIPSNHAPTASWISSAAMLSKAMKVPIVAAPRRSRLAGNTGRNGLYVAHTALMPK